MLDAQRERSLANAMIDASLNRITRQEGSDVAAPLPTKLGRRGNGIALIGSIYHLLA